MATGNMVVNVVDVGQGQCTFVEIYDTSSTPKLINALLFDCGSDKQSDETQTNLQYIADKVSTMTTPAFDCIFFSHSDNDHISLLWDLLQKFSSAKKPAVKEVWYGGAWGKYEKRSFNILNYLVSNGYCTKGNIKTPESNRTAYNRKTKKLETYLWRSSDSSINVYGIVSNVMSSDPDWDDQDETLPLSGAEALNRVSIVCGLYYLGASYVMCGDATNVTMAAINSVFTAGTTVFDKNVMTTLPHHGSRATGLAVASSKKASDEAALVVDTFSKLMKSYYITASSFEKHKHPSLELMSYFIPTKTVPVLEDTRLKASGHHRLTAYRDVDLKLSSGTSLMQGYYASSDTPTNIFTTRYSTILTFYNFPIIGSIRAGTTVVTDAKGTKKLFDAINGFASWEFTTDSAGKIWIGGKSNLTQGYFTGPVTTSATRSISAIRETGPAQVFFSAPDVDVNMPAFEVKPALVPAPVRNSANSARQFSQRLKTFR